jgi:hypothetical protein
MITETIIPIIGAKKMNKKIGITFSYLTTFCVKSSEKASFNFSIMVKSG